MDDQTQGQTPQASETPAPQPAASAGQSGYGKKGSWMKWLLIYVVIAAVVYGVVYYLYFANKTTSGY